MQGVKVLLVWDTCRITRLDFLWRMRVTVLALAIHTFTGMHAQPLIDLFSANALMSQRLQRLELSASLPIRLDTLGRLVVIDPYAIQWTTVTPSDRYAPPLMGDLTETMQGFGGAITWVQPLSAKWKVSATGILRYHALHRLAQAELQPGGAFLLSRRAKPTLTWRLGLYANHDAFGWFFMPLAGIDWRIGPRSNLYGNLPAALTYEHKPLRWLHWGLSYRSYNTSFGIRDGDFRRINENPVGAYADLYPLEKLVLRVEGGWCFLRQVRGGPGDPLFANDAALTGRYADHAIADAPYVRAVLAWRIRLD
jgi:hypothetical protein